MCCVVPFIRASRLVEYDACSRDADGRFPIGSAEFGAHGFLFSDPRFGLGLGAGCSAIAEMIGLPRHKDDAVCSLAESNDLPLEGEKHIEPVLVDEHSVRSKRVEPGVDFHGRRCADVLDFYCEVHTSATILAEFHRSSTNGRDLEPRPLFGGVGETRQPVSLDGSGGLPRRFSSGMPVSVQRLLYEVKTQPAHQECWER